MSTDGTDDSAPTIEVDRDLVSDQNEIATSFKAAQDLHRIIVVSPTRSGRSYLASIFETIGRIMPEALQHFESEVARWCDEYSDEYRDADLLEIDLVTAVYWFDRTLERVVVAYGVSTVPEAPRDTNRLRRFPDVSIGVGRAMGEDAFAADRGHFLSHAAGGELDINLFPQRRELNRGWSSQGKVFRQMERSAANHPGTFHFHRAQYDDDTWIPSSLKYGVLQNDLEWWIEDFVNK